jgi:Ser/Thr protein kinase RdoA (MazF antagonist)
MIAALHDRTVEEVARAANLALADPANDDELVLLDSDVMNHALRKHVLREGAATEDSPGPVFCHDDLQQGNVLAEHGGNGNLQLTGLIDFGNARAADALFDLAKALLCCGHEDPRSPEHLLAGYGEINHPAPKEALWLYTLFHRVSMWCWLTRHGDISGPACLLRDLEEMTRSGA